MKAKPAFFVIGILTIGLCTPCAQGGILAGPITNAANGHAYYLLSENDWRSSEAEAVSLGGHLATVRNAAEQAWVFRTFAFYGGVTNRALWIGLNDLRDWYQWEWTSGEPVTYTNWAPAEPNNIGREPCVHFWPPGYSNAGQWNNHLPDIISFKRDGRALTLHGIAEVAPAARARRGPLR